MPQSLLVSVIDWGRHAYGWCQRRVPERPGSPFMWAMLVPAATGRRGTFSISHEPRETGDVTVILGASAVIVADGAILLVQRGHEPQLGRWSVPGGKVEQGETLEEAASREAYEETGLVVRVGVELWSLTIPYGDGAFEVHDFAATVTGGTLRAGDDAADVRWVPFGELEDLPLTDGLIGYLRRGGVLPAG